MSRAPRINLDKLVRRIVLDVRLLKWFADHGRRPAALSAIDLARQQAYAAGRATLDFLQQHVGGGDQTQNREE